MDTPAQVAASCNVKITLSHHPTQWDPAKKGEWPHIAWVVELRRGPWAWATDFTQGIANLPGELGDMATKAPTIYVINSVNAALKTGMHQGRRLTPPCDSEVLAAFAMDVAAYLGVFSCEEWCDDQGDAPDSRTSRKTWKALRKAFTKMARLFGLRGLADLIDAAREWEART